MNPTLPGPSAAGWGLPPAPRLREHLRAGSVDALGKPLGIEPN